MLSSEQLGAELLVIPEFGPAKVNLREEVESTFRVLAAHPLYFVEPLVHELSSFLYVFHNVFKVSLVRLLVAECLCSRKLGRRAGAQPHAQEIVEALPQPH